jgi:hypothetical protein
MQILFSEAMLKSIESHIQEARGKGAILDVYRTAEIIRVKHLADNVALEDIIEQIVLNAGSNLPVEFNMPAFVVEERTGVINDSPVGLLMPEDGTIH